MAIAVFGIFRTGTMTDTTGQTLTFNEDTLQNVVKWYKPQQFHRAPLVLGHPVDDRPSYGNVKKLFLHDSILYAEAEINNDLILMIQNGRYKKISSSFFKPEAVSNPTRGNAFYLRHVGFLGASPPAVKGLPDPQMTLSSTLKFMEVLNLESDFACFNESPYLTRNEQIHAKAKYLQECCKGMRYETALNHILNY